MRDQLEAILLKAQKLANEANEADSMKKALEAAKVARELIDKERERRWLRSCLLYTSLFIVDHNHYFVEELVDWFAGGGEQKQRV